MSEEKKYTEVVGQALNVWKPTQKGDSVEGKIIVFNPEGKYGLQCTIMTEKGEEVVLPSHKMLQNRLQDFRKGDRVKVLFDGTTPSKNANNNPMSVYKVYRVE